MRNTGAWGTRKSKGNSKSKCRSLTPEGDSGWQRTAILLVASFEIYIVDQVFSCEPEI